MSKAPFFLPKNTWIVSDTHWGHENIIKFCRRPVDHEDAMIQEWQDAVPADGVVLHLGDLSYTNNGMFRHLISKKLPGSKYLIKGNHDSQRPIFYRDSGFTVIKPFEMRYGSHIVSFSHYPLKLSARVGPNRVHVHGHIHNNGYGGKGAPFTPFAAGQINVSVEQTHYRPVNLKELLDGYIDGCYEPNSISLDQLSKEAERAH